MKSLLQSAAILVFLSVGCGNDSGGSAGNGGSPASGGARSGGAANSGGTNASGGATSSSGGAATSGGTTSSSGGTTSSSGGSNTSGGKASGGASSGGAPASGGSASGGRESTGGAGGGQASGGRASGGAGGQGTAGTSSSGGAGGGAAGGGSTQSAGCGKAPTIMSSQYNNGTTIPITVGGVARRYVLNVPKNYDMNKPYKLVVTLHARDGNDKRMYNWNYYGLLPLSNDTAIFVAPNGSQTNNQPCTGTGDCEASCGWPNSGGKDLALVDAVVAEMEKNFCIDTTRIFATGWSYGGSMSYAVGCARPLGGTEASWGVRAIALYSAAQLSGNCTPSMPVAFYASHGTKDSVLNYEQMGSLPLAQNFAKANGCTWATPTKVTSGNHVCSNMMGCKMGYPLEYCSFNGDHTPFPDNGTASGSWGPQEAWKFLNQF
ncbi:MAG TPA: hypothetical protein VFQ61_18905 [Polyangiaceae bacterium]|nr:hypothetical protein [Polyangiaceae bacterium]